MEPFLFKSDDAFPWRKEQYFRLLIDGSEFFPAMLHTINAAKSHVLIEMYIMESGQVVDRFIEALVQAVKRGIVVQVLLDDYGSRGLSDSDRKRMTEGGARLAFFNPLRFEFFKSKFKNNLFRTHRKFMIIDGNTAYVGGAGLSDSFVGEAAWHDCMLEIRGPVAADWQTLFRRNMERWSEHLEIPPAQSDSFKDGAPGRLVFTSGGVRLQLKRILLNRIRGGRRRIWLASAYFIPSGKIRRALRRSALQGNDVRLLLPGPLTDHPAVRYASRRYYSRLLRDGVRIFEYQKAFMHSKVVLVDDWCTIGSSNLDRWNFLWNLEANQEVEDPDLATEVQNMLLNDFQQSEEIDYKSWLHRSRLQRLKEWLWGKIDRWLTGWRQDK
jgi:phosphatidylserine/phosphatidylglycerophosphate/cardiolipin synthase-like enzyme